MITRASLYGEYLLLETQLVAINEQKAALFEAYRNQLKIERRGGTEVSAEIAYCKRAFRWLIAFGKNSEKVLDQDSRVEAIIDEIQRSLRAGTQIATRAPRIAEVKASASSAPTNQARFANSNPSAAPSLSAALATVPESKDALGTVAPSSDSQSAAVNSGEPASQTEPPCILGSALAPQPGEAGSSNDESAGAAGGEAVVRLGPFRKESIEPEIIGSPAASTNSNPLPSSPPLSGNSDRACLPVPRHPSGIARSTILTDDDPYNRIPDFLNRAPVSETRQ